MIMSTFTVITHYGIPVILKFEISLQYNSESVAQHSYRASKLQVQNSSTGMHEDTMALLALLQKCYIMLYIVVHHCYAAVVTLYCYVTAYVTLRLRNDSRTVSNTQSKLYFWSRRGDRPTRNYSPYLNMRSLSEAVCCSHLCHVAKSGCHSQGRTTPSLRALPNHDLWSNPRGWEKTIRDWVQQGKTPVFHSTTSNLDSQSPTSIKIPACLSSFTNFGDKLSTIELIWLALLWLQCVSACVCKSLQSWWCKPWPARDSQPG